VVFEF